MQNFSSRVGCPQGCPLTWVSAKGVEGGFPIRQTFHAGVCLLLQLNILLARGLATRRVQPSEPLRGASRQGGRCSRSLSACMLGRSGRAQRWHAGAAQRRAAAQARQGAAQKAAEAAAAAAAPWRASGVCGDRSTQLQRSRQHGLLAYRPGGAPRVGRCT